jgi:hypothetical protein
MTRVESKSPADLIDAERYPVSDLTSPVTQALIAVQRRSLAEKGVAILPGFVKPAVLAEMAREALALQARAHLEDVWGSPYLALPDESFPPGHPRRANLHSLTWVIAYDMIACSSPLRALYEWDPLMHFIGDILERRPLYRMADPLGALNMTVMTHSHEQCWHYDNTEFVVSLAIQSSEQGGKFECAPFIRDDEDEHYPTVAGVLRGEARERVEIFPMTPGTLMIFAGRRSLHRVSPVAGEVPRIVALLAYDSQPDTDSSAIFKMLRYGRSAPLPAGSS